LEEKQLSKELSCAAGFWTPNKTQHSNGASCAVLACRTGNALVISIGVELGALEAHDGTSDNDYVADFLKRQGVNLCFSWRWALVGRWIGVGA
jgi:hypothetical protein